MPEARLKRAREVNQPSGETWESTRAWLATQPEGPFLDYGNPRWLTVVGRLLMEIEALKCEIPPRSRAQPSIYVSRALEDRKWYVFASLHPVTRAIEGPFRSKRAAEVEARKYSLVPAINGLSPENPQ